MSVLPGWTFKACSFSTDTSTVEVSQPRTSQTERETGCRGEEAEAWGGAFLLEQVGYEIGGLTGNLTTYFSRG